jgi:pentatricopeptide repeat protein
MKRNYYRITEEVKKRVAQGKLKDAIKLYEMHPDPFSATFLISHAYKQLRDLSLAFEIYHTLQSSSSKPDNFVYNSLIRACQELGQTSHITSLWKDMQQQKYP